MKQAIKLNFICLVFSSILWSMESAQRTHIEIDHVYADLEARLEYLKIHDTEAFYFVEYLSDNMLEYGQARIDLAELKVIEFHRRQEVIKPRSLEFFSMAVIDQQEKMSKIFKLSQQIDTGIASLPANEPLRKIFTSLKSHFDHQYIQRMVKLYRQNEIKSFIEAMMEAHSPSIIKL